MTLSSSLTHGQDSVLTISRSRKFQFDVAGGYLNNNLSSIDKVLRTYGHNLQSKDFATVSFSMGFFVKRILIRAETTWFFGKQIHHPGDLNTSFTGNTSSFGAGYALIDKPKFRFYPYAGISFTDASLEFFDNSSVTDMDAFVNSTSRNRTLTFNNSASLDLGFQIDGIMPLTGNAWDCPQNPRFMTLGMRVGYYLPLNEISGTHKGNELSGAPSFSLKGPYVKLVIGFGAKVRALKWKQ